MEMSGSDKTLKSYTKFVVCVFIAFLLLQVFLVLPGMKKQKENCLKDPSLDYCRHYK